MQSHNPTIIPIQDLKKARREIEKIGSDPKSVAIMAPKAVSRCIRLENVVLQDAIIIKQDMLSLGGEVAIPSGAFSLEADPGEILIMGTLQQHRELIVKLRRHYPRIQRLAAELETLLTSII